MDSSHTLTVVLMSSDMEHQAFKMEYGVHFSSVAKMTLGSNDSGLCHRNYSTGYKVCGGLVGSLFVSTACRG